jgi:hypothetical protein
MHYVIFYFVDYAQSEAVVFTMFNIAVPFFFFSGVSD